MILRLRVQILPMANGNYTGKHKFDASLAENWLRPGSTGQNIEPIILRSRVQILPGPATGTQRQKVEKTRLAENWLHSEMEVLDPATDTGRHKFDVTSLAENWLWPGSTVVEYSTYNPEIEGSNPATWHWQIENDKKCLTKKLVAPLQRSGRIFNP